MQALRAALRLVPARRITPLLSPPLLPSPLRGARSVSFKLASRNKQAPNRLNKEDLAEIRFLLARDNLKKYLEERDEAALDQALEDNKAALECSPALKYFFQCIEILYAGKRYQDVVDQVDAHLYWYHKDQNLLEYRAQAHIKLGNYEAALVDIAYMLKHFDIREKDKEDLFQQKVDCEVALEQFDTAYETIKDCLIRGIMLDKSLKEVVDELGNYADAIQLLDRVIARQTETIPELHLCKSYFLSQSGHPESALAEYNFTPEGEKKTDFFSDYIEILGNLGRWQEEIDILKSQIGTKYDNLELRELLLHKQYVQFQFDQVIAGAEVAKKKGKMQPYVTFLVGEALMFRGRFQEALELINETMAHQQAEIEIGKHDLDLIYEQDPRDTSMFSLRLERHCFARAMCYVALGSPLKALADLAQLTTEPLAMRIVDRLTQLKDASSPFTDEDFAALEKAGLAYNMGLKKAREKKYDEAAVDFSTALQCETLHRFPFLIHKFNITLAHASACEPLRRFNESLADCDAILDIFPSDNINVFNVQKACLSAVEKYDDIAKIVQTYHLHDPLDNTSPHLALAKTYYDCARDYQKAYDELYKCEHQDTREWQFLLYCVCHELYKVDETLHAVNKFLRRGDLDDEERGWALLKRAENTARKLQKEKKEKSNKEGVKSIMKDVEECVKLNPYAQDYALKFRAQVYYTITKQYDKAMESFSSLSDRLQAHFGIAKCLNAMNQKEEAKKHWARLLKHTEEPTNDGEVIAFRGQVLHHMGKYEDAIASYSMSILVGQNDDHFVANCYHQRAEAYFHLGDTTKAEQDLKKAVELNPSKKDEYMSLDLRAKEKECTVQMQEK